MTQSDCDFFNFNHYTDVIKELAICKPYVNIIVDNTSYGLMRNVPLLKEVSEKTGVNIITGTGMYIHFHS